MLLEKLLLFYSGWSILYKGAISVVVSTAFVLAVNQYYQRRKRGVWSQGLPSLPVGPQQSSTIHPVCYNSYNNQFIFLTMTMSSDTKEGASLQVLQTQLNIRCFVKVQSMAFALYHDGLTL